MVYDMCFGESCSDTLHNEEQTALKAAAAKCLPAYACSFHSNADPITWAVLEPPTTPMHMPKFTICRIDPCIMVMVEDHAHRRRFSSASTVEDALIFAWATAQEAILAIHNIHNPAGTTQ